jgi:hypothetical protein
MVLTAVVITAPPASAAVKIQPGRGLRKESRRQTSAPRTWRKAASYRRSMKIAWSNE